MNRLNNTIKPFGIWLRIERFVTNKRPCYVNVKVASGNIFAEFISYIFLNTSINNRTVEVITLILNVCMHCVGPVHFSLTLFRSNDLHFLPILSY